MLSLDNDHLAMAAFKGQPLHQMISALEATSTVATRASLELHGTSRQPGISTTLPPDWHTAPTPLTTAGMASHASKLSTVPWDWQTAPTLPQAGMAPHASKLSRTIVQNPLETPGSDTQDGHTAPTPLTTAGMASHASKPPTTQDWQTAPTPLTTAGMASHASKRSHTWHTAPTLPQAGTASHAAQMAISTDVVKTDRSLSPVTLDASQASDISTTITDPPIGLVDPLAGYAKRARFDSSLSPTAIWVRHHLGPSSNLWQDDKLIRLWPPPQAQLLQSIRTALSWKPKARTVPIFKFEFSEEAAAHNFDILQQHDFDLNKIMLHDPHSPLRPGSEFRPVGLLEPILGTHFLWPRVRDTMLHGAHYHLFPLDDALRHQDLEEAIVFGNHKSAIKHGPETLATLRKEISKGWQLPIPMDRLLDIPHLVLTPVGMAEQTKLQASGERLPDLRLTHNMSMTFTPSGTSLNSRVDTSQLSKCVYGFALTRFINAIVELRRRHPESIIYLSKFDLKSAYRRIHLRGKAALQSCVSTQGLQESEETVLALLGLRMTFGGKPNPAIFCETSDCIVDLAIAISQCPDWSPAELPSSYSHVLKDPIRLPEHVPFAPARPALVQPSIPAAGTVDGFIDDVFSANVVTNKNLRADRLAQAVLLSMEILGRPNTEFEPLVRDLLLSLEKAEAEGTPNELLIVLGWLLDTRRLLISLPQDKYIAWTNDLKAIINPPRAAHKYIPGKTLESMEGRLQHVATVMPLAGHFMHLVRDATRRAVTHGRTRLSYLERDQFVFWLSLLTRAFHGVSMNSAIPRVPSCVYRNDACEHGLGGFSLKTGRAWRWEIPKHLIGKRSINFLEFLAAVVSIALGIEEGEIQRHDNVLSATDNSSTNGWIPKSNFNATGDQAAHAALAQWLATMGISNDVDFSSIWFMGLLNWVADPLSRKQHPSDEVLTALLLAKFPEQVPSTFKISPLPEKISSAIYSLVQTETPEMLLLPTLTVRPTPPGADGLNFSSCVASATTPSLTASPPTTESASSWHSPKPFASAPGANPLKDMIAWLQAHARPPSITWERPSPPPVDLTQDMTITATLSHFYSDFSGDTPTTTQARYTRKRSHGH